MHSAYSSARLELDSLLNERRQKAHADVDAAVERLRSAAQRDGLDAEQVESLLKPLQELAANLDQLNEPARIVTLPDLVRAREREAETQLATAVRAKAERDGQPPQPRRELKRVRLSEIAPVRMVHAPEEWQRVARELDEQILTLLRDFDVELE